MNIFPATKDPYLIVSPPYTDNSSGVRTLHVLCHLLNEAGERAFILPTFNSPTELNINPALITPLIDQNTLNFYFNNCRPIVVYPDIAKGNPIKVKRVVRYLLAPRGLYGGDSEFLPTDQIWGAHPSLAPNVLTIPVSDPDIFYFGTKIRKGACFYSHKYDHIHGNTLLPITEEAKRLGGSLMDIAETLRTSEVCYLYEMSSIIAEANMCGCPVVLVRTPYFNSIPMGDHIFCDVRWNDGEILKNENKLEFHDVFKKAIYDCYNQIENFIQKTQQI